MFKLETSGQYSWPVKVDIPADGGKADKHTFDALFKRLPADRVDEIGKLLTAGEILPDAVLAEILIGWSGVADGEGNAVPFSEEARTRLLNIHPVGNCVLLAWLESLKVGRAKN